MTINENEIVLTSVGTIFAYLASKNYFIPWIIKFWDWINKKKKENDDRNINLSDTIHKMKMNENEYYEKTFTTLLSQIDSLEQQLKDYARELEELRSEILHLNAKLYKKSLVIVDLQKKCCLNKNCAERVCCENKIEDLIENEDK